MKKRFVDKAVFWWVIKKGHMGWCVIEYYEEKGYRHSKPVRYTYTWQEAVAEANARINTLSGAK